MTSRNDNDFSRDSSIERSAESDSRPNTQGGKGREWSILEKVALASIGEQRKARRWGILFKSLTFLYLFVILAVMFPVADNNLPASVKEHVALVDVQGLISADSPANANDIVGALRDAFEAESAVAVIISINSPGGSPVQAGYVSDEIYRLREKHPDKKVYAVIADLGASGGYYIASAADEIYANRASLVGSIGVISAGFGFSGAMEKLGVDRRVYTAGSSKSFLDTFSPEKTEDREFWQGVLEVTHKQFIAEVKRGRGDRLLDDPKLFSGLIWTGEQAVALGLIDDLGSVGSVARDIIGTSEIRDYTRIKHPWEQFAEQFGASFGHGLSALFRPVLQ